ncbi:polysaccharide lyase [Sorangium sp. So ce363]|uniref:polysaccharide lyase n=1 Tax=Sorangium sp. So ce363 TaxID=3133304 RepID=UPI003F602CBC
MTSTDLLTAHRSLLAPSRALLARRPRRSLSTLAAAALATTLTAGASAAPVWTGDFETGNLNQWNTTLNGEHISVVTSPVLQGTRAGRVQLTNDARWSNGIKRVELNHKPAAGRTAEGAQTYFAWSFYLPEALAADPPTQIGYWESENSYNQMMSFEVVGQHISFATRKPDNKVHWEADGAVTPGVWHRIALHIRWSTNPNQGSVDVWFDGKQVVTGGKAQTLADNNAHFTQIGLLRNPSEFTDSPVIVLDDAVEGDTLEDVRPALPSSGEGGAGGAGGSGGAGGAGGSGGADGSGGSGSTGTAGGGATGGSDGAGGDVAPGPSASSSSSAASGAGSTGAGTGGTDEVEVAEGDDGGCSFRAAGSPAAPAPMALAGLGLIAALASARRRERR